MLLKALSDFQNENLVILSPSDNVIKVCEFLNIKYIKTINFTKKDYLINSIKVKREIKRLIAIIGDCDIHFSHTQLDIFCFILINSLNQSSKNTVFHNFEFIYDTPNKKDYLNLNYIKINLLRVIYKIVYKIPIEVRSITNNLYAISYSIDNILSNCSKIIDDKDNYFNSTLSYFKTLKIQNQPIDNLFIASMIDNKELFDLDKLKPIIEFINTSDFTVKMHPKMKSIAEFNKCKIAETFLPTELLFGSVTNCIISIHSAALITGSYFENVKTISLLDIVFKESEFKIKTKNYLIKESNNRILFPKSVDELISICNENK